MKSEWIEEARKEFVRELYQESEWMNSILEEALEIDALNGSSLAEADSGITELIVALDPQQKEENTFTGEISFTAPKCSFSSMMRAVEWRLGDRLCSYAFQDFPWTLSFSLTNLDFD